MAKRVKIERIASRNYEVIIMSIASVASPNNTIRGWYARNIETCAATDNFFDLEEYKKLKKIWRRSKIDFDSACRFMDYHDLLSVAGVTVN